MELELGGCGTEADLLEPPGSGGGPHPLPQLDFDYAYSDINTPAPRVDHAMDTDQAGRIHDLDSTTDDCTDEPAQGDRTNSVGTDKKKISFARRVEEFPFLRRHEDPYLSGLGFAVCNICQVRERLSSQLFRGREGAAVDRSSSPLWVGMDGEKGIHVCNVPNDKCL